MPHSTPGLTDFLAAKRAEVKSSRKKNEFFVDVVIPGNNYPSHNNNNNNMPPQQMKVITSRDSTPRPRTPIEISPSRIMSSRASTPTAYNPRIGTPRASTPRAKTPTVGHTHTHVSVKTMIDPDNRGDAFTKIRSSSRSSQNNNNNYNNNNNNNNNNRFTVEDSYNDSTHDIRHPPSSSKTSVMDVPTPTRHDIFRHEFKPQQNSFSFFSKGAKYRQPVSMVATPRGTRSGSSSQSHTRISSHRGASANTPRSPNTVVVNEKDVVRSYIPNKIGAKDPHINSSKFDDMPDEGSDTLRSQGSQSNQDRPSSASRTTSPTISKKRKLVVDLKLPPNFSHGLTQKENIVKGPHNRGFQRSLSASETESKSDDISTITHDNMPNPEINKVNKTVSRVHPVASECNKPLEGVSLSTPMSKHPASISRATSASYVSQSPSGYNFGIDAPWTTQYTIGTTRYNDGYNNIKVLTPSRTPSMGPSTEIMSVEGGNTPCTSTNLVPIQVGSKTEGRVTDYLDNAVICDTKTAKKISMIDELWRKLQVKENHVRIASDEGRAPPCRYLLEITKAMLEVSDQYQKLGEYVRSEIVSSHVDMLLRWPRGSRRRNSYEDWLVLSGGVGIKKASQNNSGARNTNESVATLGSSEAQLEYDIEYHRQEQRSLALQRTAYAYSCQGRYHDAKRALEECIIVEKERRNQSQLEKRRRSCLSAIRTSFEPNIDQGGELDLAATFLLRMQEIDDAKVHSLSNLGLCTESNEGDLKTAYGLSAPCLCADVPVELYINLISAITKQVSSASSPDKVPFTRAAFEEAHRRVLCVSAALSYQSGRALGALKSPFLVAKLMVRGSLENREFYTSERYKIASELLCSRLYLVDTLIGGIYAYYQDIVGNDEYDQSVVPNDIRGSLDFIQRRFLVARVTLLLATCQRLGLEELGDTYPLTQRAIDVIASWSEWVSKSPFSLSSKESEVSNEHSERWVMQIKNAKKYLVFLKLIDTPSSDPQWNPLKVNTPPLTVPSPVLSYLTCRSSHSFGLSLLKTVSHRPSKTHKQHGSTPISSTMINSVNSIQSLKQTPRSIRGVESSLDRSVMSVSESMGASQSSKTPIHKRNAIKLDKIAPNPPSEVILRASSGSPPKNAPTTYQSTPRRPNPVSLTSSASRQSQSDRTLKKQTASVSIDFYPSLQSSVKSNRNEDDNGIVSQNGSVSQNGEFAQSIIHHPKQDTNMYGQSKHMHSMSYSNVPTQEGHQPINSESGSVSKLVGVSDTIRMTPVQYGEHRSLTVDTPGDPPPVSITATTIPYNTSHDGEVTINNFDNSNMTDTSKKQKDNPPSQWEYKDQSLYSNFAKPHIRANVSVTVGPGNLLLTAPEIDPQHRNRVHNKYLPHVLHRPESLEGRARTVRKAPAGEAAPVRYERMRTY